MPGMGLAAAYGADNVSQRLRQRIMDRLAQQQAEHRMGLEDQQMALRQQEAQRAAEEFKLTQKDRELAMADRRAAADAATGLKEDQQAITAFTTNPVGAPLTPKIAGRARMIGLPIDTVPGVAGPAAIQGLASLDAPMAGAALPRESTSGYEARGATQADEVSQRRLDEAAAAKADLERQRQDDREANIRLAASLRQPPAAKEDKREWVLRDGKPVRVSEGDIRPGDAPYQPPRSTGETAQDRQRLGRLESARGFLGRLNELRQKINTKTGPEAGITGTFRRGAAAIGMDPDVSEYERVRAAGGRALAVAVMGAQNLSDADAKAWSDMLPGATVDAITAKRLTDQIGKMLDDAPGATPAPAAPQSNSGETPEQRRARIRKAAGL